MINTIGENKKYQYTDDTDQALKIYVNFSDFKKLTVHTLTRDFS